MKYTITFIFILVSSSLLGQSKEIPKTNQVHLLKNFNERYEMLNNYLIQEEYATEENNTLYLFNLYSWVEYDLSDSCGIYVFGLKTSDPTYFLFFENKDKSYSIIKKKSLPLILNTANVFFEINGIKEKEAQLFYVLSLLKFFNINNDYLVAEKYLSSDWNK